ncbi:MAG: ribonuclease HII [Clostridia bacterium]|nr:ribonuclease HII [Clostridia bacterium]
MEKKTSLKQIEATVKVMQPDEALHYLYSIQETSGANLEKLIEKFIKKREDQDREYIRLSKMMKYENEAYKKEYRYIAGIDEAGRGPLAGPVVAAAVILPKDCYLEGLNDSKQISAKQRDLLFDQIKEVAVSYGIGIIDEKCIDEINILEATKLAMLEAIKQLNPTPDFLLIDSVKLNQALISYKAMDKGDSLSVSIAAASVLAKVTRDRMIEEADKLYPEYGFAKHKGYGTKDHIEAIRKFGLSPIHRISFTKNFAG